jgi:hypothetical protein
LSGTQGRDEGTGLNDHAKLNMLDEEQQDLLKEVNITTNNRGEERLGGDVEKARQSVRKAIKDAIKVIRTKLPAMADHLDQSITYGHRIAYAPKDGSPAWVM